MSRRFCSAVSVDSSHHGQRVLHVGACFAALGGLTALACDYTSVSEGHTVDTAGQAGVAAEIPVGSQSGGNANSSGGAEAGGTSGQQTQGTGGINDAGTGGAVTSGNDTGGTSTGGLLTSGAAGALGSDGGTSTSGGTYNGESGSGEPEGTGGLSNGGAGGSSTGGVTGSGGTSTGGTLSSGGASTGGDAGSGGTSTGGTTSSGGASTGGVAGSGGTSTGGTTSSGGASTGGVAGSGGTSTGGGGTGGATGGTGGTPCSTPNGDPDDCTEECPCAEGEGQCTNSDECVSPFVCATDAGLKFGFGGNACVRAHCDNDDLDADETGVDCGGTCGCSGSFMPLGLTVELDTEARAVNEDGSVIVGQIDGSTGFIWYESSGMETIELASPRCISGDGTVVGGDDGLTNGYLWTEADGLNNALEPTPVSGTSTMWLGLDNNGRRAVYLAGNYGGTFSSLWVADTGATPFTGDRTSVAALSGDGTTAVGQSAGNIPFKWTEAGGLVTVGDLVGGSDEGAALGVSTDGSVIVGYVGSTSGTQAFRCSSGTMYGLGDLSGGEYESEALGVSGDGQRVIGWGTTAAGQEPFIWDPDSDMRRLVDELAARGIEMPTGWSIGSVVAISGDGTSIVGHGTNADGKTEPWRITLD